MSNQLHIAPLGPQYGTLHIVPLGPQYGAATPQRPGLTSPLFPHDKRIARRPYPIPKISTTLQELEGFTYAMALDLNMGYYTIRLDPNAVEMFTIIFPWGKYLYLRLPMGYAGSADIFQAEMMDLMASLEYVRAYIDDLLVITRGTLEDHFEKLGEVLRRLREAGLKVNAAKSFFCTHKLEYLGWDMQVQQTSSMQK